MLVEKRKKGKGRGKGCRALVLCLFLSGCAGSIPSDSLQRWDKANDGLKNFYGAFCEPVPAGKEEACNDGRKAVNTVGEVYNAANELFGEDE